MVSLLGYTYKVPERRNRFSKINICINDILGMQLVTIAHIIKFEVTYIIYNIKALDWSQ